MGHPTLSVPLTGGRTASLAPQARADQPDGTWEPVKRTNLDEVDYTYRFVKSGFVSLDAKQHWSLEGSGRFEWTMQPGVSTADTLATSAVTASEPAVIAYNAGVAALTMAWPTFRTPTV